MPMDVIWVNSTVLLLVLEENSKNKILGITCHNSKKLAKNAISNKANYVAFGSFF